jgi:molecular chaperone HtpG
MTTHKFQVDLRGMIRLLSGHLYSSPEVFLRELLQNAVDAIHARELAQGAEAPAGRVTFELITPAGSLPTIVVEDNGIGLTEEQVHRFLATIGESSKRDDLNSARQDFIGQFGVGLLSCFTVADEIVAVTRSAEKPDSPTLEWRGQADGTYTLRKLEHDIEPGARVFLRARSDAVEFFSASRLEQLVRKYGEFLPCQIQVTSGPKSVRIDRAAPWSAAPADSSPTAASSRTTAGKTSRPPSRSKPPRGTAGLREFAEQLLGEPVLDAFEIRTDAGDISGVGCVLAHPSVPTARTRARVYLRGMLVAEEVENLLPDWAVFVRCVVNSTQLHPVASRETLVEDAELAAARDELGRVVQGYLIDLARADPERLHRLMQLHNRTIRALAARDEQCFQALADHLTFETTLGTMTLGEYRAANPVVRYAPTVDEFRQLAQVAAAQNLCVINAGYTYDTDVLAMLETVDPESSVERVDASALARSFDELSLAERQAAMRLLRVAEAALQPFRCAAEIRKFEPENLAGLYTTNPQATFVREADEAREQADSLWAGLIDAASADARRQGFAQLCFNQRNPLVQSLLAVSDQELLARMVQLLYVQSLLLGHYPLSSREMGLLTSGLGELMQRAMRPEPGSKD